MVDSKGDTYTCYRIMASQRGLPASPPRQRSLVRRVPRAVAIAVGSLLLVAAIAIAALVRPDIPLEALLPEYGAPPSQFVELEGMRIHYRDEGAGPPLVLLHGFGSSLHTWDGWVRQLTGTRRLIRLDLPGFGLTGPAPDGDYRAERYVHVVAALLDRLGVDRTDIAGNSLGGRTALDVRACAPAAGAQADPRRRRRLRADAAANSVPAGADAHGGPLATAPCHAALRSPPQPRDCLRDVSPTFLFSRDSL